MQNDPTDPPPAAPLLELISALSDGELSGAELEWVLLQLRADEAGRRCWGEYHLIGEVLRANLVPTGGADDAAFVLRLRQRLLRDRGGDGSDS